MHMQVQVRRSQRIGYGRDGQSHLSLQYRGAWVHRAQASLTSLRCKKEHTKNSRRPCQTASAAAVATALDSKKGRLLAQCWCPTADEQHIDAVLLHSFVLHCYG
jgi:hypothetical protein